MKRIVLTLLIILLLPSCQNASTQLPPKPTSTITLNPTETQRSTQTQNICDDAISAGARTKYAFDEIVPCLDTIEEVSAFMQNNMMYDNAFDIRERGGNEYTPAWLVYERGVDDCDGHAILQCYFFEKNDIDAVMVGINIDSSTGHNVCAVSVKDGVIILDNKGAVVGQFSSIQEFASQFYDPDTHLGTIAASQITQIITDTTEPSVFSLPWNMIWGEWKLEKIPEG